MPRGKHNRKNKLNETALTTQLMRISLRMDDHIYNNKPVAGAEAARYLQEIAKLKLQCPPTNARALQVIEKLTRLMKNILTEEDSGHASSFNTFHINTEFAGSASPVYSLAEEDRLEDIYDQNNMDLNTTCITDDDEPIPKQIDVSGRQNNIPAEFVTSASSVYALTDENRGKDRQEKELDMDNLNTTPIPPDGISRREMSISREQVNLNTSNNQGYISTTPADNSISNKAFDNGEVIDITIDSDLDDTNAIAAVCNRQSVSIEYVNSGISNMVIQDEVGKQKKPIDDFDDNCSQTLLDNYANDNDNANGRDKVIENKSYKEKDVKARVINKVNNYFQKQTPLAAIYSQDIFAAADSQTTTVDLNNDSKSVSQGVLLENNKMGMKKKAGKEKIKPKKRKTKKTLKSKENNTAYLKDSVNATTSQHSTYVTNNSYINKENPVTFKKSRKPKKVHEIYNENVENDLSWVENLRYVREISPSEYDPALSMLPDNFWDNFELPGIWNDVDFEV